MGKLKVASFFCGCGGTDVGLLENFLYQGKHYASNDMGIVYADIIFEDNAGAYEELLCVR